MAELPRNYVDVVDISLSLQNTSGYSEQRTRAGKDASLRDGFARVQAGMESIFESLTGAEVDKDGFEYTDAELAMKRANEESRNKSGVANEPTIEGAQ